MSILPQNGGLGLFSIDPGATPDQIAKKRAMIAAMMPQYGKARYVGEGIGQLATGIATGMANRKMDKFEADKRAEASEAYRNLVGGGPLSVLGMKDDWGTTFAAEPSMPAAQASPTADYAATAPVDDTYKIGIPISQAPPRQTEQYPVGVAASPWAGKEAIDRDAMAAIGRGGADEIRSGLIKRGLPEHIADGFMMNFQDESGLDPGINEASPLVPGSRGGFGLSQWTGPRRRALEAFAADRGTPVSNVDTQLDFLISELQGPESAAAREIFGSKTSGEAAAAIVNKFLRPAEEHRASREARYLGGKSRVGTGPQVAYNGPSVAELASALSNPWLSQEERGVVGMMLQQAQQANDPMRAMEMERAQLELDALRNSKPNVPDSVLSREMLAERAGLQPGTPEYQTYMATGNLDPMRALEMERAQLGLETDRLKLDQLRNGIDPDGDNVRSSEILADGTVVQSTDRGVKVYDAAGRRIEGDKAVEAVRAARDYEVNNQRSIYSARREGTNIAEAETGGAAAAAKSIGGKQGGFVESAFTGADAVAGSINNINTAIAALDAGARSGAIDKYIPNITEASASLQNAMDRMGLDVIGSVTFGALSEGELRLAMETAVPRNLDEPQLRDWLIKKRDAQQKVRVALIEQARFLSDPNNSLKDWADRLSTDDPATTGAATHPATTGAATHPATTGTATHRFNPATGKIEAVQ